jgi:HEPN domain-containing protein
MKKSLADLARAWQRKAASDLAAAEACLRAGCGLDAACFHCQQAAEKALKAFLISRDEDYPRTHDLRRLIALCARAEPKFKSLEAVAKRLNPYAVDFRYEPDFWPDAKLLRSLIAAARAVVDFAVEQSATPPSTSAPKK